MILILLQKNEKHGSKLRLSGSNPWSKDKGKVTGTIPAFRGKREKVLFVDPRDSFVHTLASYVRQTGAEVTTLRSGFPHQMLDDQKPDLLFSPGPGRPAEQGSELVGCVEREPGFGVCLGHQGIAEHFGGRLNTFDTPTTESQELSIMARRSLKNYPIRSKQDAITVFMSTGKHCRNA